jgi:hypothetical protein
LSICLVIIENGGEKMHIAADSRVAVEENGFRYHLNDDAIKLHEFENFIAYISGHMGMAELVAKEIKRRKTGQNDDVIIGVVQICKEVYSEYVKSRPYLKDKKHTLQVVIPFLQKNVNKFAFFENDDDFSPRVYGTRGDKFIWGIGSGAKKVLPIVDKWFKKMNTLRLLQKAFSETADETCGGKLTYFELSRHRVKKFSAIIPDQRPLRKLPDKNELFGEGDGVTATPDGYESGRVYIEKLNGSYNIMYFTSNYAEERSIKLKDDEIEIFSDEGQLKIDCANLIANISGSAKIQHDSGFIFELNETGDTFTITMPNGTYCEYTPTGKTEYIVGDYTINATGNFKVNAARIDLN